MTTQLKKAFDEIWLKYHNMSQGDTELYEHLFALFNSEIERVIDDLEFRLIDNRISPYDEKYQIMKTDIKTVRTKFEQRNRLKEI